MKTTLKMSVVVIMTIVSLFINLNTAKADIEIVYLGGAHLPDDATSPSWTTVSNNRMQQIRNQLGGTANPIGVGKQRAIVTAMDYSKMVITPTYESWSGVLESGTGEHGNRYHVAFGVFANGGSNFIPSSVSLTVQGYIFDPEVGYIAYGNQTSTTLTTVNNFRVRMSAGPDTINGTGDDIVTTTQSGSIASTGFIFGGQGKGYLPMGSGLPQDQINNRIAWMRDNKLAVKYTCTLGEISVVKWVLGNDLSQPKPVIVGTSFLNWKSVGEPVKLHKSNNLINWTPTENWIWMREGTNNVFNLSDYPASPSMFYRLERH